MNLKDLNIENLVRSAVVLAVGLPVTLSLGGLVNTATGIARQGEPTVGDVAQTAIKDQLAAPCIKYIVSKEDSRLEREAKNEIDEVLGGEVSHGAVCKWAL